MIRIHELRTERRAIGRSDGKNLLKFPDDAVAMRRGMTTADANTAVEKNS